MHVYSASLLLLDVKVTNWKVNMFHNQNPLNLDSDMDSLDYLDL